MEGRERGGGKRTLRRLAWRKEVAALSLSIKRTDSYAYESGTSVTAARAINMRKRHLQSI